MGQCIINGKRGSTVSAADRGFRYGDGVFETIAAQNGVPYRFDWHIGRLERGLNAIRIAYDTSRLRRDCQVLLDEAETGLLRIQITRGEGGRGYLPEPTEPTCVIEMLPMPEVPAQPVDLWLSSYKKPSSDILPVRYKLCQGLNSTLARMEAADHGCFDALMLSPEGHIAETSSATIFWVKDGKVYTPSLDTGALEGATRAALMELCTIKEERAELAALENAEAVFITNTAWNVLPVARLLPLGLAWDSAPAARRMLALLENDRRKHCKPLVKRCKNG